MVDEDSGDDGEEWIHVGGGSDSRGGYVTRKEYEEMCRPSSGGGGSGCLISILEIMAGGAALSYPLYEGIKYLVG